MNIGIHHYIRKYRLHSLLRNNNICEEEIIENRRFRNFINHSVYGVGILGIIVIIPQILKIWVEKDFGVSLTTWIGFFVGALFWFFYGIIHKEKPIIFTNLAVIIADLFVITGLIFLQ